MTLKTVLNFKAEKKHSIRYDNRDDDEFLSSIYIMKDALPKPWPTSVVVTVDYEGAQ